MRGATPMPQNKWVINLFQSTLLMRGATCEIVRKSCERGISIHAPHARSDRRTQRTRRRVIDFNPRSSCEERHELDEAVDKLQEISIHAPHARSDRRAARLLRVDARDFNPRSSCEERHGW